MLLSFRKLLFFLLAFGFFLQPAQAVELKESSVDFPLYVNDYEKVRVSLVKHAKEVTLETEDAFEILDAQGRSVFGGANLQSSKVIAAPEGIQMGSKKFQEREITFLTQAGAVKVDGRLYRHALKVWREPDQTISIVNEISMEDYLKGVLPREVSPKWDFETLKAQAIASRTYAFFKAMEQQGKRYALTKDVSSQVYGGKTSESTMTSKAVEATRGLVLTYRNQIFPAYFHATCGGATTQAHTVWSVKSHSALTGVRCHFCQQSKHYRWKNTIPISEIETKLNKGGIKVAGIQEIEISKKDSFGRAKEFQVIDQNGRTRIRANQFRLALDPMTFKSTWLQTIRREGDTFFFRGRGWGHGVGFCQWGAKRLGELGYTYEDILKYYYPGAQITDIHTRRPRRQNASFFGKLKSWFT